MSDDDPREHDKEFRPRYLSRPLPAQINIERGRYRGRGESEREETGYRTADDP